MENKIFKARKWSKPLIRMREAGLYMTRRKSKLLIFVEKLTPLDFFQISVIFKHLEINFRKYIYLAQNLERSGNERKR